MVFVRQLRVNNFCVRISLPGLEKVFYLLQYCNLNCFCSGVKGLIPNDSCAKMSLHCLEVKAGEGENEIRGNG